MHLNEWPCKVETPEKTWTNYRVQIERATPGPWKATMFAKDGQLRGSLGRVSRVTHLGNRQWLIVGEDASWRITRLTGCGCHANTSDTPAETVDYLNEVTASEDWEVTV